MQLPLVVVKLFDEIAQNEGFSNHTFELESGSKSGDNYQGLMVSVKLIGDRIKDGVTGSETLNLICKVAPESKNRRDVFKTVAAYEREIYMYTRVLPTFVKFQQEKGLAADQSFLSFPKVYAWTADKVNETYALIMEDLRSKDFVMWPRHDPIDFCHEKLLFTQLGRFHGVSFAMKDQQPKIFAEFKKMDDLYIVWIETGFLGNIADETFERAIDVLEKDEHKHVINQIKNTYLDTWKSFLTKEAVEKSGVVGHGDCWINNFMFQYNENTKEVNDICFLDFQFTRYASPVMDVLYQLFSSTRKSLRDQNYEDLLHIYYTSLSDTVFRLGSNPEKLFRFSDLRTELKAYGKFALIMGLLSLPFALAQPDEVVDIEEYAEHLLKGEKVSMFKTDGRVNATYVTAVNEMVSDVIGYGYDCGNDFGQ